MGLLPHVLPGQVGVQWALITPSLLFVGLLTLACKLSAGLSSIPGQCPVVAVALPHEGQLLILSLSFLKRLYPSMAALQACEQFRSISIILMRL